MKKIWKKVKAALVGAPSPVSTTKRAAPRQRRTTVKASGAKVIGTRVQSQRKPPNLMQAMRVVAKSTGQLWGLIEPKALREAYRVLGNAMGYYAMALASLGDSIPVCPKDMNPVRWVFWLMRRAQTDLETWTRAALRGALLRIPLAIIESWANQTEAQYGSNFAIVRAKAGHHSRVVCVHLRGPDGRPTILRGFIINGATPDGFVHVRDEAKGKIALKTADASGVKVYRGWCVPLPEALVAIGADADAGRTAINALSRYNDTQVRQPAGREPGVAVVRTSP